jgi:hypothetical protein
MSLRRDADEGIGGAHTRCGRLAFQIVFEALPQKYRVALIDLLEPSHSSSGVGKPLGRDWRRRQDVLCLSCTHKYLSTNDSYELILD